MMKRYMCLSAFVFGVILSFRVMAETKTYVCGENCTATLDDSGVMRVSGTGAMYGYDNNTRYETPWYQDRNKIKSIVVEDGITSVGESAFFTCNNIKTIELAQSVKKIENGAFDEIYGIQSVTMYDSTIWNSQDDFNASSNSPNIKINCYGDLDKCQTHFLHTPKMKSKTNFNYKGKKIYTVEEASKVAGERNTVTIRYQ